MKKALAVALFGGLAIFFVPLAAHGGTAPGHAVATNHETAGSGEGGCATTNEGKPEAPKQQDAPGQGRSHYDREHHDGPEVTS